MQIGLGTVRQSPFVGVFSIATERVIFVPKSIARKEAKAVKDLFGLEAIKATVANSSLLGVFAVANNKGLVASGIIGEREVEELQKMGVRVKRVENVTAVGNHMAVNDRNGVCSTLFSEKQRKQLGRFLSIDLAYGSVAGSRLVGAGLVATNKGFLISPGATEKEFAALSKHFGLEGRPSTANCGDAFVGNSVIANSSSALLGLHTTGHEMARIDECLGGA